MAAIEGGETVASKNWLEAHVVEGATSPEIEEINSLNVGVRRRDLKKRGEECGKLTRNWGGGWELSLSQLYKLVKPVHKKRPGRRGVGNGKAS